MHAHSQSLPVLVDACVNNVLLQTACVISINEALLQLIDTVRTMFINLLLHKPHTLLSSGFTHN